jgi:NAD(P)-dependent dehydrogenase (short-subunit alcohol dehydrogenase family)
MARGPRTVLVTGASRGIGLAVARALADSGAWVGMVARDERLLAESARELGAAAFPADVSSAAAVQHLAVNVREAIGAAPDAIVNAAGAFALAPFGELTPEAFDRQLEVNLRGPFLVIRAFLGEMLERRHGHIVNIGSIAGRVPLPGNAGYSASKYGLVGLHQVLAAELSGTGVRVTMIEPAATDTSLWDPLDPDSRTDLPSRSRMLRPDDVARAVLFALEQPGNVEVGYVGLRRVDS